jgi:hypothetical protein
VKAEGNLEDFVVGRGDLRRTAFVPAAHTPDSPLEPGEILVHITRFALTANNITYGAVGEMIGYWTFFPAPEGWGRIPVWGFADVVRSQHGSMAVGERLYGYFPMSQYLVLRPERVAAGSFVDATPHRAALPPVYNQYTRLTGQSHDAAREAEIALFRPLFATSFLLDDFLAESALFDAQAVVLSSASSKTALGLAFLLAQAKRCPVIALTSARNRDFVARTGYYASILGYDDVDRLPAETRTLFIDFAGNGALVKAVHSRLGNALTRSIQVGVTHWERMAPASDLPGPTPVFFFAPDRVTKRIADWGAPEFQRRVGEAMRRFLASASSWLRVVEGRGPAALESAYRAMLEGRIDPAEGHVLSL